MLKHLVHSHHGKLQSFDEFYKTSTTHSKAIKSRLASNEVLAGTTNHYSSPSPTSPCSPNSNPYTFYNVFADWKLTTTPDAVIEEDENEEDLPIDPRESQPITPVFYLDEEHHHQPSSQTSSTSSSPHWPSLIFNRLRHSHPINHAIIKQNSINENQMNSTKIRKNELVDPSTSKHRFLKRSETVDNTDGLTDKKYPNEDFPELSLPTNNFVKKHRSFAVFFHHSQTSPSTKSSSKSSSTGTLHTDNSHETTRAKLSKHKPISTSIEIDSPVKKSPPTPLIPKLASFFHRHHLSEQHKYRVGNLKARLHHRRHSPPLNNPTPKFHCQMSDELIRAVQQLENERIAQQNDYIQLQPSLKPVIMKRVHTWHNSFDLRPLDQCLEY